MIHEPYFILGPYRHLVIDSVWYSVLKIVGPHALNLKL